MFFETAAAFRAWLMKNAASKTELSVGFHKKSSGKPGITYKEAVDQALCFGWIDGVRRSLDESRYTGRFTPRQAKSIWSAVNMARVAELERQGLMQPAGLAAFERRDPARINRYSFEQASIELGPAQLKLFKANERAWA
jgi:uncharacterized protein YdeI (YjbR/CyaY-like superfamily)